MKKFMAGMLAGTALLIAGAEYMDMNKSTKRKIMKKGKAIANKAEDMIEDMSGDMF
jgi:hypothetical protein